MIGLWLAANQVAAALLVGGAYLFAPGAVAGGHFYGVTVAPGRPGSPEGRAVVRRYRFAVAACTAFALLAALAAAAAGGHPLLGAFALLLQVVGCTSAWLSARGAARPWAIPVAPSSVRRAALGPVAGALSPLLDLAGFAALAAAGLVLWTRWDAIPEQFPTHWGAAGPDRFGARAARDVFLPLVVGAAVTGFVVSLRWVLHLTLPSGATPRARATRALTVQGLVGASWLTAAIFAAAALTPLTGGPAPVLLVSVLGLLAFNAWLLLGLARLRTLPADPPGAGQPDAAWRWGGLLYVNPDDPALWVPKRMGLGYTINLGHARGKLAVALLLLLPLGVALVAALAR